MAKIGINGFGRTGKLFLRALLERQPTKLIPIAINDPNIQNPKYAAYIFKHDSTHGRFYGSVCSDEKNLIVNSNKIAISKENDGKKIPWNDAEYLVDCSGKNTNNENVKKLINGKIKKVIITEPSSDIPMFVLGVNHNEYKTSCKILSMGSSTLNSLAPLAKVVHEKFGIRQGFVTTVEAATSTQKILDSFSADSFRIGRCSFWNIIPAQSANAVETIGKVIPDLQGKITGLSVRVPTPIGALLDFTIRICKSSKLSEINETIRDSAQCSMNGILCYTDEEVVSTDFIGCTCSAIYDANSSLQLGENFFKLIAWYDNEYGYACRLADFLAFIYDKDVEEECEKQKDKPSSNSNSK